MATKILIDSVAYLVGEGRCPEVTIAPEAFAFLPQEEETRPMVVLATQELVRHARRFSLPLGRLYSL